MSLDNERKENYCYRGKKIIVTKSEFQALALCK